MKFSFLSSVLIVLLFCGSCKPTIEDKTQFIPSFSTYIHPEDADTTQIRNEISYGILTPVEICAIFNRLGVPYSNATLNPVSNRDLYLSSAKASLAAGIYGVDFGYLKLFGIGQEMIDYAFTIRCLSNKLGIPDDYLINTLEKLQKTVPEPDTILSCMNNAFVEMEDHLRESGRESTAGLMVMAGWVEAMFIATQLVYDPANPDPMVVQKIAEQKYTLNSLMSFIKNYYDDPVVVYYSKKLKYLNHYFDSFNIYFKVGDLEIDTVKQVFRSSGSEMDVTVETLDKIKEYVATLRAEIVKP